MTGPRVLFVTATAMSRGAETQALQVVTELRSRTTTADIVALVRGHGRSQQLPVEVLGKQAFSPRTLRSLRRRAKAYDVVVAFGSTALPACAIALSGHTTPWVYRNIGDPAAWQRTRLQRWRTGLALRKAAGVIALWNGSAESIESTYGIPASRIRVIPNNRSAATLSPASDEQRSAARRLWQLPDTAPTVAVVGALSEEKRTDLAIAAVSHLEGVHLIVAGDGPQRANYEQAAARVAPGRVHFLGSVRDVTTVYHAADTVVLTSRTEGMPGVLIEAGLCGIPAVSTDVGAVRDIVIEGVSGFVVPPDPHIIASRLVDTLGFVSEQRQIAREVCAQRFDTTVVVSQWQEYLTSFIRALSR